MVAAAERLLRGHQAEPDPVAARAAGIVERITADPGLRRVATLTEEFGASERQLQRLLAEYVGVSPKWVMRRARLHEAALRADTGDDVDWAALARDLGYADQAHLTRDFTATLGTSPARYAARSGSA
jgi:AraC-like DNA-binding protein